MQKYGEFIAKIKLQPESLYEVVPVIIKIVFPHVIVYDGNNSIWQFL